MTMKQQMQSSAYPLKYADVRKLIVAPSTTDTHRLLGATGICPYGEYPVRQAP